jgi:hypothetical protein
MIENYNTTRLPHYILTLYGDAFLGALFTALIDLAWVQTGNPSFTASETLFIWLLLGTLLHLFNSVTNALINRYMLRCLANAPAMPEPPVADAPMPVTFTVPDEETHDDSFWRMEEEGGFRHSMEASDE